ncbi:ubiquitin-protein ligase peroxin 12 [Sporobolomyces salmoneus]|uniref:ubiquitin-protein ligase peroxin 12 n=1 Tax=Sporobolomyces salmoneus TaxID=183962 RepID=UPI00316CDA3E
MEYTTDLAHQNDPYRPSLFELAAQDQLRDLLSPVVRYVLSVFAQRNPRYLLRLVNSHDELFSLAMLFVERHYLVNYSASFSEHFYGLKRRKVLSRRGGGADKEERTKAAFELTGKSEKLGKREIRGSLVALILLPYLKTKAQDWFERLGGGVDSDLFAESSARTSFLSILKNPDLSFRARMNLFLQTLFKQSYPYFTFFYEIYLLVYNLRYLFGRSPYWRPWFKLLGIEVRRMGQEDYQNLSTVPSYLTTLLAPPPSSPPTTRPPVLLVLRRLLSLSPRIALDSLSVALPMAIFGFRFLEWWYSPSGGASRIRGSGGKNGSAQPALRAPPSATSKKEKQSNGMEKGICPIHKGKLENPTALPSGVVACYKCLRSTEIVEDAKEEGGTGLGKVWIPDLGKGGERVEAGRLRRIMG